jgi:hypothetical protein
MRRGSASWFRLLSAFAFVQLVQVASPAFLRDLRGAADPLRSALRIRSAAGFRSSTDASSVSSGFVFDMTAL